MAQILIRQTLWTRKNFDIEVQGALALREQAVLRFEALPQEKGRPGLSSIAWGLEALANPPVAP